MAKTRPIVCLAMPIGHWSAFLARAFCSVKVQNSQDYNLAVLDAANDPRVADDLKACGLKLDYYREGPDGGQTSAISEGWREVSGDIVAWLNGDDMLLPGVFDLVIDHFANHPETDVFYGQSSISDEGGAVIGLHPEVGPPSDLLLRSNIISQPSCFVRRKAFDDVGGLNNALEYTMDWDFWTRLYQAGKTFVYKDRVLSNVTWELETKTASFNRRRTAELFTVLRRSQSLFSCSKSLFGFLQHHLATYTSNNGSGAASLTTPIVGQLVMPIMNLSNQPHDILTLTLGGAIKQPIKVIIDGRCQEISKRSQSFELAVPVAPGGVSTIEVHARPEDKISFLRAEHSSFSSTLP